MPPVENLSISDVPGILVGHAQEEEALTGCTVVLCKNGAVGGIDQRGGAPGTRETDLLHPVHLVHRVHAVLLTGGSAYGLDAAGGVMRYLEEQSIGFSVGPVVVPIVPAAVIFDLGLGKADLRPDAAMGYRACQNATTDPPAQGNAGAGMGATVGKILGMGQAMKSGVGTAGMEIAPGIFIGALVVVNSLGDVVDPDSGRILAGARAPQAVGYIPGSQASFPGTLNLLKNLAQGAPMDFSSSTNTVIGVVATNVHLDKEGANKFAQMAQDGVSRTIRPAHTMMDGDTMFALSTGDAKLDLNVIGAFSAEVIAQAVVNAVRFAAPAGGLPSASEFEI